MRLVEYDIKKLGAAANGGFKKSENLVLIEEFANSGLDCMKVEGWTHKTPYCCAGALNKSIERYKKRGIRAVTKDGEVFLVKVDAK